MSGLADMPSHFTDGKTGSLQTSIKRVIDTNSPQGFTNIDLFKSPNNLCRHKQSFHFTDEKTKAQRLGILPKVTGLGLGPRLSGSRACTQAAGHMAVAHHTPAPPRDRGSELTRTVRLQGTQGLGFSLCLKTSSL